MRESKIAPTLTTPSPPPSRNEATHVDNMISEAALAHVVADKVEADVRAVIVLADGDDPGEAAARDAALRWKREARPERQ